MDLKTHLRDDHGITALNTNLRQIVYGGNDGIVTTFAVVAGFAGAQAEGAAEIGTIAVVLFGLANLFADATSMGLGEFLSARAARDVYASKRAGEVRRIREAASEERQEVLFLLRSKGLSDGDAVALADQLEKHPELMADFMMQYEFGMPDPDDGDPRINGLFTFGSFIVFGFLPLLPYFFLEGGSLAFGISVSAALIALVFLGLLRWVATRERLGRCLAETLLVGVTCGLVAFVVGVLVGG